MKSLHKRTPTPEAAKAPSDPAAGPAPSVMPADILQKALQERFQAFLAAQYDSGAKFNSGVRYAASPADTTPSAPVAKVKMDLRGRDDEDLDFFVSNHIELITGNPDFTDQQPPPADLLAAYSLFETKLVAHQQIRDLAKQATLEKDQARKALEDLMVRRGAYVQEASAGNAAKILAVGLAVTSPRTPVGELGQPMNLRAYIGEVVGRMELRWDAVAKARGYIVECSVNEMPRKYVLLKSCTKAFLLLENLKPGDTLVFRVAAQGGSTGQGPWSAELIRTVG